MKLERKPDVINKKLGYKTGTVTVEDFVKISDMTDFVIVPDVDSDFELCEGNADVILASPFAKYKTNEIIYDDNKYKLSIRDYELFR